MLEIRFHGRGGQGTVVASILLAKAYFDAGSYVQSFPLFGVERRGAPVEAFLRIDSREIRTRTNVYAPNHIVVMDRTLLHSINVALGLQTGGWILVNAPSLPEEFRASGFSGYRTAFVDATRIALRNRLGSRTHPIVNTAMMGAFSRILGAPPMDSVAKAIQEEIPDRAEDNIRAAREAYEEVRSAESSPLEAFGRAGI